MIRYLARGKERRERSMNLVSLEVRTDVGDTILLSQISSNLLGSGKESVVIKKGRLRRSAMPPILITVMA